MIILESIGLVNEDEDLYLKKNSEMSLERIIPQEGRFLGLDISKRSTGIALIEDGKYISGNITLDDQKGPHKEVLLRRALKDDLLELVRGKTFDLIVLEDAYIGENADTVRKLYALNTAIDEIILDGLCECNKFLRVSNQTWKSWLYTLDKYKVTKGYNDKEKIKVCLEMIGVSDRGEGYQDRLDSLGMLVGYFLKGKKEVDKGRFTNKKVNIKDVEFAYEIDTGYLFYGRDDIDLSKVEFFEGRISKSRIVELLTENPDTVFISSDIIKLGYLGESLELGVIDEGGYFAFGIKKSRRKKYLE